MAPPAVTGKQANPPPVDLGDDDSPPAAAPNPTGNDAGQTDTATVVDASAVDDGNPPTPTRTANPTPTEPAAATTWDYNFWRRFHLVVGGGGSFGSSVHGTSEPFASTAQGLGGGHFFLQPTLSALATGNGFDRPNGLFELRLGLDIRDHILSNPSNPGVPDSDVNAFSIGLLVEPIVNIHRHFGIGGNINLGYRALFSDNADVGAPFPANLDGDGGFAVGGQVFLNFWDGNIRLGGSIDATPTEFDLDAGPGNPPLRTGIDPIWGVFLGLDVTGIIRSASGGGASNPPVSSE